jgi:DNA repair photolyase
MTRSHDASPDPEDLVKVAQIAASLGLHGVFMLAPKCPGCGKVHNFAFFTDLADDEVREGSVQKLMVDMAKQMLARNPDNEIVMDGRVQ